MSYLYDILHKLRDLVLIERKRFWTPLLEKRLVGECIHPIGVNERTL